MTTPTSPQTILKTQHLSKQVQLKDETLTILHDINLTIANSETVAITGVSGSGKSTLLSLLAGLDLPTSGQIHLDNHELTALNEDQRAQLRAQYVGFVFQSFLLFPHLTALENVLLPLELANTRADKNQATEFLQRVGLQQRLHHYPHQLSGGEQQRVAIARAFASQPKILFADEVTGNLDQHTGSLITKVLFDLNSEQKTTLILVTHDEKLAQRCQRVLQLDNGRMVAP